MFGVCAAVEGLIVAIVRLGCPSGVAAIGAARMRCAVAAAGAMREGHAANLGKKVGVVGDAVADDVDHFAFLLQPAAHRDH